MRPFVVQVVERVNLGNAVEFAEAGHKDDCHRGLILRLHRRFKDMLMDVVRALRERGQSGNINWSEQRQWLDDSASKAVQNHEHLVVKEALVSDVTEGVMGLSTDFLELLRNIAYAEVSLDEYRSVDALRLVIANLLGDAGRRSFIGEENPLSRVSWDRSDYEDGARNVLSVTIAHVLRNLDSQDLIQMQRYYSGIDLGRRLAGGEIDLSPFVEEEVEDLYTDYLRLSRSSQSSRVIFEGGDFEETELTQLIGVLNDQELRFERDEVDKHFVQGVAVGLYLEAALGGNFDFNTTFRGAFDSDISRLVDLDRFPIDQIICDLIIRSLLTLRVRGQRLSSETDGIDRDYVRDRLALSSDQVFPGITR